MTALSRICDRLELNAQLISRLVRRVPADVISKRVAPDEFAVIEHICHLRDLERDGFAPRIVDMLTKTDPQLVDFDGAGVARASDYMSEDRNDALAAFLNARLHNIASVRDAAPAALKRTGHYEQGFPVTFAAVLEGILSHDEEHLQRLEALNAALFTGRR